MAASNRLSTGVGECCYAYSNEVAAIDEIAADPRMVGVHFQESEKVL